jgi:hypothetical protein
MRTKAFIFALAALVLRVGAPGFGLVAAAALPKDPCALLKQADIQAINATAKVGKGKPSPDVSGFAVGCTYEWGIRTPEWGMSSLQINITDTSKVYPNGLSADEIKQRVGMMVKMGGPGAEQVSDIGDGALFTIEPRAHNTKVTAFVVKDKGVILEAIFHGDANDALAKKDALAGLLGLAASRL